MLVQGSVARFWQQTRTTGKPCTGEGRHIKALAGELRPPANRCQKSPRVCMTAVWHQCTEPNTVLNQLWVAMFAAPASNC